MNRSLLTPLLFAYLLAAGPILAQTAGITNCPSQYSFDHCGVSMIDVDAVGEGQLLFELVSGPGSIDPNSGLWSWLGDDIPQSADTTIEIRVVDDNGPSDICAVNVLVTNSAPVVEPVGHLMIAYMDYPNTVQLMASDSDHCDDLTITLGAGADYNPANVTIVGDLLTFTPDGMARTIQMELIVSDGEAWDVIVIDWYILHRAPLAVSIEARTSQIQGYFTELDVVLHWSYPEDGLGGFNLLFGYDASALSLPSAVEGDIYGECDWEYFTYRTEASCGTACPSGLFRVVGVANTNDGARTPGCDSPGYGYVQHENVPITLTSLRFMVSNDRTLECQFVPVKFFWTECGDNAFSNHDGSELHLSVDVYDYVEGDEYPFEQGWPTEEPVFPGSLGPIDECLFEQGDKIISAEYDLRHGGVGIACAEVNYSRGDINKNNVAFEIADVVMLTNYFLIGLPAFGSHVEGSISAADTNADGVPLTVGDLVHLIRVVTGEISAFD